MAPDYNQNMQERLTRFERKLEELHSTMQSLHEQFNHLFVALLAAGLTAIYLATR
jgi:hypothetical protein